MSGQLYAVKGGLFDRPNPGPYAECHACGARLNEHVDGRCPKPLITDADIPF